MNAPCRIVLPSSGRRPRNEESVKQSKRAVEENTVPVPPSRRSGSDTQHVFAFLNRFCLIVVLVIRKLVNIALSHELDS